MQTDLDHMRAKEASKYLGVGLSTIWLYVKQGKINTVKLSDRVTIFKRKDLDNFINKITIDVSENEVQKS